MIQGTAHFLPSEKNRACFKHMTALRIGDSHIFNQRNIRTDFMRPVCKALRLCKIKHGCSLVKPCLEAFT